MFIPIGDDNSRRRRFPFIVYLLIALNAYVWWLQLTLGDAFTAAYAAVPFELTTGKDLISPQLIQIGRESIPIPQAPGPHPLMITMFSAMFMHGSWMHIIGNMLYLGIFGDQIEDLFGHAKFLVFYIICGLAASLAQIMVDPNSVIPTLGASGAIAGVLGAYLLRFPSNRVKVLLFRNIVALPASAVLGMWIVLQFLGQITVMGEQAGGVAYMAHIGGFMAGAALLLLFNPIRR